MPPTFTTLREDYPIAGWSSSWSHPQFAPTPYSLPYGLFLKAGGSTGRFSVYNQGMFYRCSPDYGAGGMLYFGQTYIPGSDFPPQILILGTFGYDITFIHIPFRAGPPLPFQYYCDTIQAWPNPRQPVLMATNGAWVPPLLPGEMGPNTTITPFNRGAYEKYA